MLLNVGGIDRIMRIALGIVLILGTPPLLGYTGNLGWIGVVPLATGIFSICPLYKVLGINTCKVKKP